MPSITTHHMFAREVYKKLPKEEQVRCGNALSIYLTFAQSHDYLFYYTFDIKNSKKIKELGHYAHHNKTQDYLINIVKVIKEKHLENNSQAIAYLYGSITHFCLDSTCHPYIFYKTGIYRKENPNSLKYVGEHNRMEKDLDAIYYEKYTGKKYNKCNISKDIIGNPKFTDELTDLISTVYKMTYNEENIGTFYKKSITHAKIISSLAINDSLGIKKAIYSIIDFLTKKRWGLLKCYSTHLIHPNTSYLNLEHQEWNHPSNKDITYTYSFEELYNISLEKALKIIHSINKVLFKNKNISMLYKTIPNLDYSTGVPLDESRRMDFFEE